MNIPSTQADGASTVFDDRRIVRERIRVGDGPVGSTLCYAAEGPVRWAALLAGPHPLLGGEHSNNVVQAIQTAYAAHGAAALAFDYAPTGAEEDKVAWLESVSTFWRDGRVPQERLWVENAKVALAELRRWSRGPLVLAGYSFGAWVVSQIAPCADARAIVLVSPNPSKHAFDQVNETCADLLIVHSNNDFACAADELMRWFDGLREPKRRLLIDAGEHFFRGREAEVAEAAVEFFASGAMRQK